MSIKPTSYGAPYEGRRAEPRGFLNIDLNRTPTFVPNFYLPIFDPKWAGRSVHALYTAPEAELDQEVTTKKLIEPISLHCEMRLQCFYQMLCLVYDTKLKFSSKNAQDQAGIKNGWSDRQLAEAHFSTIPALICWDPEGEKNAFGPDAKDFEPFIFAFQSYFYFCWNGTVRLPAFVNAIDSQIDLIRRVFLGDRSFREYATEILNRVSEGRLNPGEGFANFLARFIQISEMLNEKKESGVLNCYASVAKFYLGFIKDPENLAKLMFQKGPQLPYATVQKEMWQMMTQEVEANQIVERIQNRALFVLQGILNNKEFLVPGILLRLFPGARALHITAQQELLKLKIRSRTYLQLSYAQKLAADSKMIELAKKYFTRLAGERRDIFTLSDALIDLDGLGKKFYEKFQDRAEVVLEKKPQQPEVIFWSTLPLIYAQLNPDEDSRAVRKFLCISEGWFWQLTKDLEQIQRSIVHCCEDPKVIALAQKLVGILRNERPKEEGKREVDRSDRQYLSAKFWGFDKQ